MPVQSAQITPEPRKTQNLCARRRLTVAQLEPIRAVGRHALDDQLYFHVQRSGARGYELRYLSPETGKRRDMGLGSFPDIDPATARERAAEARSMLARGIDPLEDRRRRRDIEGERDQTRAFTLRVALAEHFKIERGAWRNRKYVDQWLPRMHAAVRPLLDTPLAKLTKGQLHDQLTALNAHSHDAAVKARVNLDKVFRRFGGTHGVPELHNPAAALVGLLPRTAPVEHHAAMHWRDVPAFVAELRDSNTWASVRLGFEWMVLTAARTSAVTHARWSDLDLAALVWHSSPDEAGNKRRGDIPISPRMLKIIDAMEPLRVPDTDWLFPSGQRRVRSKKRKVEVEGLGHPPISNEAFRQVLRRLGADYTGHGFRSGFKTWAVESEVGRALRIPEAIVEAALGHSERDAIKAAYTRADYWDERVRLARAWHDFVTRAAVTEPAKKISTEGVELP